MSMVRVRNRRRRTIVVRRVRVDGRNLRHVCRQRCDQIGIMGLCRQALAVGSEFQAQQRGKERRTLTASIHSVLSSTERALHSLRTLGSEQTACARTETTAAPQNMIKRAMLAMEGAMWGRDVLIVCGNGCEERRRCRVPFIGILGYGFESQPSDVCKSERAQ